MTSIIDQLILLQDRDVNLNKVKQDLERIPIEEAQIEEKLKQSSRQFEELKLNSQKIEVKRKELENEVKSKLAQIAKYRTQQFETRKNEEFQALGGEITRTEKEIHDIEDQELDLMEKYEAAQKEVAAENAKVKQYSQTAQTAKDNLKKKQTTLQARLKELEEEVAKMEKEIDPGAMARYRRLLASKKDIALVPIVNGKICGGCHMQIPPQTALKAKAHMELVPCDQCGRFVYWPKN